MFANEIQHGVRQRGGVVVASARTWLRHFGVQHGQPGAVRGGLLLEFACRWIGMHKDIGKHQYGVQLSWVPENAALNLCVSVRREI